MHISYAFLGAKLRLYKRLCTYVGPLVGRSVRLSVCPRITLKTDYVAIPSHLELGDPLVYIVSLSTKSQEVAAHRAKSVASLGITASTIDCRLISESTSSSRGLRHLPAKAHGVGCQRG
jgi:hypothetical protein